jgi:hypothetical protein
MSFFDSIPEQPHPPFEGPGQPAWMRPDGVIPGSAPAGLSLIRTDEAAVAVSGLRAYPNGFEFTVHARLRQEKLMWGTSPTDWIADLRTRRAPEQALRLGVLYADGRRAATSSHPSQSGDEAGGEHLILVEVGRRGTDRQWDGDFWVHPLPPDGPVTFVASWLLYGVAETRAELDSLTIHEATGRAVILWPDSKPRDLRTSLQAHRQVRCIRRLSQGRNCLVLNQWTTHLDRLPIALRDCRARKIWGTSAGALRGHR